MLYSPPNITGDLGNSAAQAVRNNRNKMAPYIDQIDGVNVEEMIKEFGSPLFVFSEYKIRETALRMKKAFHSRHKNTVFGWSYKTNYLKAICGVFHDEGWIAEVVSEFEYQKARKSGIPGKDIIFNGPHKSRKSLEVALQEGALVQIDNWDELKLIEEITSTRIAGDQYNVGIRIWMENDLTECWSKFGFALDNGEATHAILKILDNPNLRLHTLHSHIGTNIFVPEAYTVATEKLMALRDLVYQARKHLIPCINLGGGFPSSNRLHWTPEDFKIPPIEKYAEAITKVIKQVPKKQRPQLRLETGRHLIDDAGYLIASVCAVKGMDPTKTLPTSGKRSRGAYILDVGVHLLYTATWCKINASPTKPSNSALNNETRLYGCLCMNIDVIREQVDLPPLDVGDNLVLHPVGAYNLTQSMQFIELRPAVVMIGMDGFAKLIRRREELKDLEECEV